MWKRWTIQHLDISDDIFGSQTTLESEYKKGIYIFVWNTLYKVALNSEPAACPRRRFLFAYSFASGIT